MFENIGGKIKTLAKVLCWAGIIVSLIIGIFFLTIAEDSYSKEELYIVLGIGFIFVAPLLSWISSFFLYGFGELIETNCEIARNTQYNNGQSYNCISDRDKKLDDLLKSGLITQEEYEAKRNGE